MAPVAVDLLAVDRGGVREATHPGHLVVTDAAGHLQAALGDPERLTYYRSSAKPLQALAALRTGIADRFGLTQEQVAIICASHNGEARHLEVVRSLLLATEVPEDALQCGAHWPYYEPAGEAARCSMPAPIPIFNNCSGKHAGMLAASRMLEAPLDDYLAPEHPLQGRIRATVEEFTGCAASEIRYGIDGCSAPNPAVPLRAIARSLAALAQNDDPPARAIVAAMTAHPYLVGGTDRFDTRLMEVTRGRLLAKGGAAGLHCTVDLGRGRALAVKLETGEGSLTSAAVMGALAQLGWLEEGEQAELASFGRPVVRNHRKLEVGAVRVLFELAQPERVTAG
jgi:L-asparaginase II